MLSVLHLPLLTQLTSTSTPSSPPAAPAWKRPSRAPVCRLLCGAPRQRWPRPGLGGRGRGKRWWEAEAAPGRHRGPSWHARNPLAVLPPPTPTPTRLGQRAWLHPQASLGSVVSTCVNYLYLENKKGMKVGNYVFFFLVFVRSEASLPEKTCLMVCQWRREIWCFTRNY